MKVVGGLLPLASGDKNGLLSSYHFGIINRETSFGISSDISKKVKITISSGASPIIILIRTNSAGNALVFLSYSSNKFSGKILDSNIRDIKNYIKVKDNSLIISFPTTYSSMRIIAISDFTKELVSSDTGYSSITEWR